MIHQKKLITFPTFAQYQEIFGIRLQLWMMKSRPTIEWMFYGTICHHLDMIIPRLTRVGKVVLTSNAEEESLLSMVHKNKTAFRPNLNPEGTLSSILSIKLAARELAVKC